MSKLIFIYLLSLIILNTQSTPWTEIQPQQETEAKVKNPKRQLSSCSDADEVKGYKCVEEDHECKHKSKCELQIDTSKCDSTEVPNGYKCEKKGNSCTLTSSSKILGIFKISFALLIIFTIL